MAYPALRRHSFLPHKNFVHLTPNPAFERTAVR